MITYLVTISRITRGTKTGRFLLFSYKKRFILSIASASLMKSNSYPILNEEKENKIMFKKYMKRSRIMQIENLRILNQENTRELHQNLQLNKKGEKNRDRYYRTQHCR